MIDRSLRQGDVLSADSFNPILENVVRETEVNKRGTIFKRTLQCFAYADDVSLVATNSHKLEAFQEPKKASEKDELKINKIKTRSMVNTRNKIRFQDTENRNFIIIHLKE
jgi:hypothetical protein